MFQNKLNDFLAKFLRTRMFFLPCGKYSAARVLFETRRKKAPEDWIEGDHFSVYRFDPSTKHLKFRPFFLLEGTFFEAEGGTDAEYMVFPDWSLVCYAGVLALTLILGIVFQAMGLNAGLFLFSSIGLNILFYFSMIWQASECAQRFERSMRYKIRKYADIIPE